MQSLKNQIHEHLNLKKGGSKTASSNIKKATKDFYKSDAPQFRGKSKQKRHSMAVAAGLSAARGESANPILKIGDQVMYEHKEVKIQQIHESMALVKFATRRDPIIVRMVDLAPIETEQLNEGFIGIAPIGPTYREPSNYGFLKFDLNPEDIGLFALREDDDTGEVDDQEEDHDNGSNVRHDGHTGETEVDNLPKPSDTVSPAYTDEKPPKEAGTPLIIEPGAQEDLLWQKPEWDGYDYPADAPEIPTADFEGADGGNARAPHFNSSEHQPGDGQEDRPDDGNKEDDELEEGTVTDPARDESEEHHELTQMRKDLDFVNERRGSDEENESEPKSNKSRTSKRDRRTERQAKEKSKTSWMDESYFMEMDPMLDHPDMEPKDDATITVSLPAMAAILVTVCNRQPQEELLKSMVEALAEISKGKTIEMDDLDAVAAHMNGEETQEMENRKAGRPDHEGIEHGDHGEKDDDHEGHESWPGDGEKTKGGSTKLLDCGDPREMQENLYYGVDDIMAGTQLTEDELLRLVRRRIGVKFW